MSLLKTLKVYFLLSTCSSQLAHDPFVIILGITQDGGSPHAGCKNAFCKSLWQQGEKEKISSIGIINPKQRKSWMIDATPDFPQQYRRLTAEHDTELAGIFLTYAHIRHYTGLIHLGKEVMRKKCTCFVMENMEGFLKSNGPRDQLVMLKIFN